MKLCKPPPYFLIVCFLEVQLQVTFVEIGQKGIQRNSIVAKSRKKCKNFGKNRGNFKIILYELFVKNRPKYGFFAGN